MKFKYICRIQYSSADMYSHRQLSVFNKLISKTLYKLSCKSTRRL